MSVFLEHLQYPFFQRTLVACLMVGTVCGLLSTFVVLRRLVFAGVALTQLSSAGLGLAAVAGLPALPTSLATTVLGVGLLGVLRTSGRDRTDNLIALLYVGGWALSVLLFAVAQRGDSEMAAILYGDVLGVSAGDLLAFLPVALLIAALIAGLAKELLFASFDPETAETYRLPVWLYDTLMFAALGIAIVFAVKMLGLLLVFAFLVAPGTAALLFCRRLPSAMVWSVAFSVAMSVVGLAASARWDLPPGPAVTSVGLGLLLALSVLRFSLDRVPWGRNARRLRIIEPETARVTVLVAALVIVAGLAGSLSGRVGAGNAAAHLEHTAPQAESVSPSAAPTADASAHPDHFDAALPDVDKLIEQAH